MSNDLDRLELFLRERLQMSEEVLGPMGPVPYVIPIQDVLEKIKEMRQPEVPEGMCAVCGRSMNGAPWRYHSYDCTGRDKP